MSRLELRKGLVILIFHEDSEFDGPEAQHPRKLLLLHNKSDFVFSMQHPWRRGGGAGEA